MKDKQIRHRPAEIAAVVTHSARCFVIPRGDLSSADMANRFIGSRQAILLAAETPGPYTYSVQADRISPLGLTRKARSLGQDPEAAAQRQLPHCGRPARREIVD